MSSIADRPVTQLLQFLAENSSGFVANLVVGIGAAAIFAALSELLLRLRLRSRARETSSYADRINQLSVSLRSASSEVDAVLKEIATVTLERQAAAEKLKAELDTLSRTETALKDRIDTLKSVPLPVAEHFAKLLEGGERRSARRDYLLFGAGVVVSAVSAIVLKVLGVA